MFGLFKKKKQEQPQPVQEKPRKIENTPLTLKINSRNENGVLGVDTDFINELYFTSQEEKDAYIKKVEEAIDTLKLKECKSLAEINESILHLKTKMGEGIPFFSVDGSLLTNSRLVMETEDGEELTPSTREGIKGSIKVRTWYYNGLKVFAHNVEKKLENKVYDFKQEEELLNLHMQDKKADNFAALQSLYLMGHAFAEAGNKEKRDEYFNRIRNKKFSLSESTVSDFYRDIASIYNDAKELHTGLDWLKAGLALNPKLGVKKQIASLEKHLAGQ